MDELGLHRRVRELEAELATTRFDAACFRTLRSGRHDLLMELDASGRVRRVSPALVDLIGYTEAELIGRKPYEFTTPETEERLRAESPTIFDWAARRHSFELPIRTARGDEVWFEGNIYSAGDEHSGFGFFCVFRDLTETRVIATESKRLTDAVTTALNVSGIETFEFDVDEGMVMKSPGYDALMGLSPAQAASTKFDAWREVIHPEDQSIIESRMTFAKRSGGITPPVVFRVTNRSGGTRYIESSAFYLFDAKGTFRRVTGSVRDVTDREMAVRGFEALQQRSEQQLNRNEYLLERLRLAASAGRLESYDWDVLNNRRESSAGYGQIFGMTNAVALDDLDGFFKRVHPDDQPVLRDRLEQGRQRAYTAPLIVFRFNAVASSAEREHTDHHAPDDWKYIETAAVYQHNEMNQLVRVVGVVRDVTKRALAELELKSTIERLNAAMSVAQVEVFTQDLQSESFELTEGFKMMAGLDEKSNAEISEVLHQLITAPMHSKLRAINQPSRVPIDSEGGRRWVEAFTTVHSNAMGVPVRAVGAVRDVTDQVIVEQEIRAQTAFFEALVQNSPDIIVRFNRDLRIVLLNPVIEKLLGVAPQKLIGKALDEMGLPEEMAVDFRARLQRCIDEKQNEEMTYPFHGPRERVWMNARVVPELDTDGDVDFVLVFLTDVSQLKVAEQEASATARQFGQILETAEEGIVVSDQHDTIVFNNPKFEQLFGYSPNELIGKPESTFQLDDQENQFVRRRRERNQGLSESYAQRFKRKDGSSVLCWVNAKPLFDDANQFVGTLGMLTDVSDLERTEAELRQSLEWLEFSLESAQIAGLDVDLEANHARSTVLFREWFGQVDESADPVWDWLKCVHDDDRQRIEAQLKSILERGSSGRADFRLIDSEGKSRWLYAVIVTVQNLERALSRVVFTMVDITARKQLELDREALQNQVARTQKEESLGQFAGGVAHDLNNLLTTAFGHIDLVKLQVDDVEAQASLSMVDDTLATMARLSKQMLAYAGRTPINPKHFELNDCLIKVHSILGVSVGKKAKFDLDLAPIALPVFGEETQVQQIALNLLLNAAESLQGKGGLVRLATARLARHDWPESVRQKITNKAQEAALLQVSDTGTGMTADVRARMFEPFFTSKFQGRGLGLSVVDGLVRGHGGAIDVQTEPGFGTTISIYLPLENAMQSSISPVVLPIAARQNKAIVLVVDDEPSLRNLICRSLNAQGFETLSASHGDEALERVRDHPEIEAVILDLTMPNKDGLEVYVELYQNYPKLKVMLMSGYSEQSIASRLGGDIPSPAFLNKPFRVNELLQTLQQVLAG